MQAQTVSALPLEQHDHMRQGTSSIARICRWWTMAVPNLINILAVQGSDNASHVNEPMWHSNIQSVLQFSQSDHWGGQSHTGVAHPLQHWHKPSLAAVLMGGISSYVKRSVSVSSLPIKKCPPPIEIILGG